MKKLLIASVWSIFFFSFLGSGLLHADSIFVEVPAGAVLLNEFKAPVLLFVPQTFKESEPRAMLIVMPSSSYDKKLFEEWQPLAEKNRWVLMIPSVLILNGEVPYKMDEWLDKVKHAMMLRYGIKKVFLIGLGMNAHYAGYLGLKDSKFADAVACVGGSWVGPYDKITSLSTNVKKQTPFFIAIQEKDKLVAETQAKTKTMTEEGYSVRLVMLDKENEEHTEKFRSEMMGWLEERAASAAIRKQENQKTVKEKISTAVETFFAV